MSHFDTIGVKREGVFCYHRLELWSINCIHQALNLILISSLAKTENSPGDMFGEGWLNSVRWSKSAVQNFAWIWINIERIGSNLST